MNLSEQDGVNYCWQQFRDYMQYGKLTPERLCGRTVLEYGPGDSIGVGLLFVALGARRFTCIDKFYGLRDDNKERRIYLKLRETLDDEQNRNFDAGVDLSSGIKLNAEKVECVYGTGAEDAHTVFAPRQFDYLISRGVVQEIYDGDKLFRGMDQLLAPGGWMMHKIDLRDYGLFSSHGYSPLEFLTIPGWIYALMAKRSDRPARRLINYYRDKIKEYGYRGWIYCASVIDDQYQLVPKEIIPHKVKLQYGVDYTGQHLEMVRKVRSRLDGPFRSLSDEDLIVSGIFFIAQKAPFDHASGS
jgi:hypothetical protein